MTKFRCVIDASFFADNLDDAFLQLSRHFAELANGTEPPGSFLPDSHIRVLPEKPGEERKLCVGCLNIRKSRWPVTFVNFAGRALFDSEGQWKDQDGKRMVEDVVWSFCPVCGATLEEQ